MVEEDMMRTAYALLGIMLGIVLDQAVARMTRSNPESATSDESNTHLFHGSDHHEFTGPVAASVFSARDFYDR